MSLDGYNLTVSGKKDQPKGPVGAITVSVDDGSGAVNADIPVTIVKSSKPLVTTTEARIKAKAGQTVDVNLSEYTTNPFPDPLVVLDASVHVGQGTVSGNGNVLSVTPKAGFHGNMTIVYRVMDATNDPDRVVQGRVVVQVVDRPEPPQNVSVTPMGAGTAFVRFDSGASNGGTITGYTITDKFDGKTYPTRDPGTQITGLVNGEMHSFTVVAHNEAPTVVGSDGALTVSWKEPHNAGSRILSYTVLVASENGGQPVAYSASDSQLSMTIPGLKNGTMYSVQVQALNKADTPSPPSSRTEGYPHGAPDQPTDVRAVVSPSETDPNKATVQVSWTPGFSGGKGWGEATISLNGVVGQAPSDSGKATLYEVPTRRGATVSVTLKNAEGDTSTPGTASVSIVTTPAPIATPTLSGTGMPGELKVTGLSVATGRGFDASDLTLRYSEDPNSCAGGTQTSDGAILPANGWQPKTYYFCQTGINGNNQVSASPAVAATGTATGRPSEVRVSIDTVNATSLTVRWDPIGANPAVSGLKVYLNNNREQPVGVGATETTFSDLAQGTEYLATVAATNDWGTTQMQANSSVVTKLDVNLMWTDVCQGGEKHTVPGGCHTFKFSAPGWANTSLAHKCTIRSDLDGWTEEVTIDRAGPIESNIATRADSDAKFAQNVHIVGDCRPVR